MHPSTPESNVSLRDELIRKGQQVATQSLAARMNARQACAFAREAVLRSSGVMSGAKAAKLRVAMCLETLQQSRSMARHLSGKPAKPVASAKRSRKSTRTAPQAAR
jgi:hypothetical protein